MAKAFYKVTEATLQGHLALFESVGVRQAADATVYFTTTDGGVTTIAKSTPEGHYIAIRGESGSDE
jgi:hypothetical protein